MIKVTIYRNKKDKVYKFELKGHASYSKAGSDIVCSAVSTLVINTINSIEKFTNENLKYSMADKGAHIVCEFHDIKNGIDNHDVELLVNSMIFGLKTLEIDYSSYINVKDTKEVQ